MGKVTVQKSIVKVIQPAIYEYYCDECGRKLTNETNPKASHYSTGEGQIYVCRFNEKCNVFYKKPKTGRWVNYTPPGTSKEEK